MTTPLNPPESPMEHREHREPREPRAAALEPPPEAPLLSPQLRAAVRAALSPGEADQARVRASLLSGLASGELSRAALRVDALMQAGAAHGGVRVAGSMGLAGKLALAGVLVAGALGAVLWLRPSSVPAPVAPSDAPVSSAAQLAPQPSAPTPAREVATLSPSLAAGTSSSASDQAAPARDTRSHKPARSRPAAHRSSERTAESSPREARRDELAAPQASPAPRAEATASTALQPVPTPSANERPESAPNTRDAKTLEPRFELAAELRLIRAASSALDRGDAKAALSLLQQHGARFPGGALRVEAAALRAVALCHQHSEAAVAAQQRFLREHGTSPLAERVKRACTAE